MKKLIILLITFLALAYWSSTFAQVSIDSSKSYKQDNTTRLYGYATFVNVPSADDYNVGFLFGESYSDINYIPMGGYSWSNATKQLTFWTDVTNLDINSKHYYHAYIQPKASISKFEVEGNGWLEDIVCEPVIESASGTLTAEVGETLTFSVTLEQREVECSYNYQWSYKLATENEVFDTTYSDLAEPLDSMQVDTSYTYTYPEDWSNIGTNQNTWTTPTLQAIYDRAMVKVRVYNTYGEDSIQGTIRVIE